MARKFLTPITLPTLASNPSGAVLGSVYYNTTDSILKVYDGSGWIAVGGVSAAVGLLDHTHDYDGSIYTVSYGTLVDGSKFTADGGGANTSTFAVTFDGGDASGS